MKKKFIKKIFKNYLFYIFVDKLVNCKDDGVYEIYKRKEL